MVGAVEGVPAPKRAVLIVLVSVVTENVNAVLLKAVPSTVPDPTPENV